MIFGSKENKAAESAVSFEANAKNFEKEVLEASATTPILIDFWAPWCGPCKQLMPTLEKVVAAADGKVKLAKVNIDENPELAQAFQVQSVPTVMAIFQGRPVTGFQGVQPESAIKQLVDQLSSMGGGAANEDAIDIESVLEKANAALTQKDLAQAQELYSVILQEDPMHAGAYAGLVRTFIAAGSLDQAKAMLDNVSDEMKATAEVKAAQTALDLVQKGSGDLDKLQKAYEKKPDDHQACIDLAVAQFGSGAEEEAIDLLLSAIAKDPNWEDGKARAELLKLFEALGNTHALTVQGRKKLSRLLFS